MSSVTSRGAFGLEQPDAAFRLAKGLSKPSKLTGRDTVTRVLADWDRHVATGRVLRDSFTGRNPSDLGSLTHGLVESHVHLVGEDDSPTRVPGDLLQRMYAVACTFIDANPNATRVLATEAASLAYRYVTGFPPGSPWQLLGVEYNTGDGLVDLAWVNGHTGEVFFDELKTSRVSSGRVVPAPWAAQARRYSWAGFVRFSGGFLGTRLIPLMATDQTRLFVGEAPAVLLAPTVREPLHNAVVDEAAR